MIERTSQVKTENVSFHEQSGKIALVGKIYSRPDGSILVEITHEGDLLAEVKVSPTRKDWYNFLKGELCSTCEDAVKSNGWQCDTCSLNTQ